MAEVMERLGRVGIASRHAVGGLLQGRHRSLHKGLSLEFAGHRAYQPGDDLRRLDWNVYARTDRLDVRLYEEESRLTATLVVDCSGSMAYGGEERSKLDTARMLAASMAFLMVAQGDAVGLALLDGGVRHFLPPTSTMGGVLNLIDRLSTVPPGNEAELSPSLHQLSERIPSRGLTILISDFLDDTNELLGAFSHLRHRRQDLRLIQVRDRDENTFPLHGTLKLQGLEAEEPLTIDGDRMKRFYLENLKEHDQNLLDICHKTSAPLHTVDRDEDLARALTRMFVESP